MRNARIDAGVRVLLGTRYFPGYLDWSQGKSFDSAHEAYDAYCAYLGKVWS